MLAPIRVIFTSHTFDLDLRVRSLDPFFFFWLLTNKIARSPSVFGLGPLLNSSSSLEPRRLANTSIFGICDTRCA